MAAPTSDVSGMGRLLLLVFAAFPIQRQTVPVFKVVWGEPRVQCYGVPQRSTRQGSLLRVQQAMQAIYSMLA